jgi:hypothetical protein
MSIKQFILAIHKLYPNVEYTVGYDAYDVNGNKVQYDRDLVDAEIEGNAYKDKRVLEYPSIGDQLDALFHAGVFPSDMAEQIQAIKDKYPKV